MARHSSRRNAPLTTTDLMRVERVGQPAVSPDGTRVAYVVARHDLEQNRITQSILLLDLRSRERRELTPGPGQHHQPAWSPDGRLLAFVSDRDPDHGTQIWVLPLAGGEARRVTAGHGGAARPVWAPDSRRLAFTRQVVVSEDYRPPRGAGREKTAPERAQIYGLAHPKSSARVAGGLLFRHWDHWRERRRNHIFIVNVVTGRMNDVTPHDCDAPPISLGSAYDYDFSPDGREIAFVMNPDEVVARSTNNCIFVQSLSGVRPQGAARCISTSEACDCHPRYSRDGRRIYYLATGTPGYEADRNRVRCYDRESRETTEFLTRFDRSPNTFAEEHGGDLVFLAPDRGRQSIYRIRTATGQVRQLTWGTYNGLLQVLPSDTGPTRLLVTRESFCSPADFYLLTPTAGIRPLLAPGPVTTGPDDATRLTHHGDVLADVPMQPAEEFWYAGAGGTPVHGFLIRPPDFAARRRYPLILLIHGGPQSAFADQFHYRWSAQLFAAGGALVALINPRGSIGYGQRFTDQISGDWGGRCFQDLMLGVDHLLATYRFIDPQRLGAAGASFGGFMINWIAGHTDRFRALVSHDGIFNAETMAYTTDELWFDEHEHGGLPHEKRRAFLKFSPHLHVASFKTPTLVVQGEQDFRCPVSEGIGMFTALQLRGIPARYLHFPDEGHWVMQPANAVVWYDEVISWLMKYLQS